MEPIRLKLIETITAKLDGTQDVTAEVVDAATGASVLGLCGCGSALTASGRVVTLQFSGMPHEIHERREVAAAENGGVPSEQ